MIAFLSTYWSIEIIVLLAIPIYMMAWTLPRRHGVPWRAAASVATLAFITIAPLASGLITGLTITQSFYVFTALLAVFVGLIVFEFDVGIWPALFCATAGYTIQNLASGATLLVQELLTHRSAMPSDGAFSEVLTWSIALVAYALYYVLFVRRVTMKGLNVVENPLMLLMFAVVVFTIIGLDLMIKGATFDGIRFTHLVGFRILHTLICAFVLFTEYELLYAKRSLDEKAETERLLAERERQYRMSRQNIDAINIKCHDIRHQIRHLKTGEESVDKDVLADIAREVSMYDSVVETGNEALDTILTEKSLACSNEGITLSCIADGGALSFMSPSDIYSLFGNALDNAIEAVREMDDPDRRTITLNVARRMGMVAINVENYFTRELQLGKDGLPVTHKNDELNHGFGMRSMRRTIERYGGTLHAGADGRIFFLNILVPGQDE